VRVCVYGRVRKRVYAGDRPAVEELLPPRRVCLCVFVCVRARMHARAFSE
jgi:hypothetical protein